MSLDDRTARWWRLAACCPKCRRQPTDQYSFGAVERAKLAPLDEPLKNVRCKCGSVYMIAWVALAFAQPVESKPNEHMGWAA